MNSATLIFPHQLYDGHPSLFINRAVYIIEDQLFFTQYNFNKQKLVLHRATMQYYRQYLQQKGYAVHYIDYNQPLAALDTLFGYFAVQKITHVHLAEVTDYLLQRRLKRVAAKHNVLLHFSQSPNFMRSSSSNKAYFATHRYYLTDYYISLRKELDLLMLNGEPLGGKWTYDTDNRKKMPSTVQVPQLPAFPPNDFVHEAQTYVEKNFANNHGSATSFVYPVTHETAALWLDNFLQQRFGQYGIYQDAIVSGGNWLFHSILTPMLNIGLVSPQQVLERAINHARTNDIPVNSLEGFVRQVLGWREYIYAVYEAKGVQQRTTNYWQHKSSIPAAFYTGNTGIVPVDNAIKRLLQTGYNHHIERLMVLGNFMLLCEFDPDEVYRWFMELFIDSYDWVMVPNVYGMSQYADGGLMSTKPYISGSSYVLKMSNYSKGDWCVIWDALFWRFINKHKQVLAKNPRMSMMAVQVAKMDSTKLHQHIATAENFLLSFK